MATFIALELGFHKGSRVRKGEVFEAADNFKAKWAVPAKEVAKTEVVARGKTLSVPAKPGSDLA